MGDPPSSRSLRIFGPNHEPRVIRAQGLDENDKVLRQSVGFRIVHALRMAVKRVTVADGGKRKGVWIWWV
jgi:hypothetical protein